MTALFADLAERHGLLHKQTSHDAHLYSADMVHRYAFGRWWGDADPASSDVWVLFNPATGDTEQRYRPTLERCAKWSKAAGRSGLIIVNLFAYRHTDPKQVPRALDPIGPANNDVLRAVAQAGARTVAAWGRPGVLLGRSAHVSKLLRDPFCLGTTANGQPRHPGRVPADAALVPWQPPRT